jgi:hypothetical protein
MSASGWKKKNRKKQKTYWLHHIIKEELGRKKYNLLLSSGKLRILEKELTKGNTIYQLLSSI